MEHIKRLAIAAVTDVFGITENEMNSKGKNGKISRKTSHVAARRYVYILLSEYSNLSLIAIGKTFNGQDHSTVIHARRQHNNYMDYEQKYIRIWLAIRDRFLILKDGYESVLNTLDVDMRELELMRLNASMNAIQDKINELRNGIHVEDLNVKQQTA